MLLSDLIQRQGDMKNRRCIISPIFQESVTVSSVLEHMHFRKLNYFDHYQRSYTEGPAAFDVNFHSLLIEVQEATVKKCVFVEDGFKCLRESIFSVFYS